MKYGQRKVLETQNAHSLSFPLHFMAILCPFHSISWPFSVLSFPFHAHSLSFPFHFMAILCPFLSISWPFSVLSFPFHGHSCPFLSISCPFSVLSSPFHAHSLSFPLHFMPILCPCNHSSLLNVQMSRLFCPNPCSKCKDHIKPHSKGINGRSNPKMPIKPNFYSSFGI